MRGTREQVAVMEWLMDFVDSPDKGPQEMRVSGEEDVIRMFRPTHRKAPKGLYDMTNQVRTIARVRRIFFLSTLGAIAMRGSQEEVSRAEKAISELDK